MSLVRCYSVHFIRTDAADISQIWLWLSNVRTGDEFRPPLYECQRQETLRNYDILRPVQHSFVAPTNTYCADFKGAKLESNFSNTHGREFLPMFYSDKSISIHSHVRQYGDVLDLIKTKTTFLRSVLQLAWLNEKADDQKRTVIWGCLVSSKVALMLILWG